MFRKSLLVGALTAVGLLAGPKMASAVLIIDDFTTNQTVSASTSTPPVHDSSTFSGAGPIGGVRDMTISILGGTAATPGGSSDSNVTNAGRLTASLANNTNGITTVIWDGLSTDASNPRVVQFGLTGVDLTQGGTQTFLEVLGQGDLQGTIRVTLYQDGTNFSTLSKKLSGGNAFDLLQYKYVDFVATGTGVIFTDVKAIKLEVDGNTDGVSVAGLDANIQFFQTGGDTGVPEPVTAGLSFLSLGALSLVATRRRRA